MALSPEEERALGLFKEAAALEADGELKDAVRLYKKAYELHDKVDILCRQLAAASVQEPEPGPDEAGQTGAEEPDDSGKESLLANLPLEIRARILAYVALQSMGDYRRAVRAGRPFWVPCDSALFWEPMCHNTYADAADHLHKYEGWASMFRQRAHLRFDGVYVSQVKYLRYGEPELGSWMPPVIEVTYYRYLRFFPDGTVGILLSSNQPSHVLPFVAPFKQMGSWMLDPEKCSLDISSASNVVDYDFHMHLRVSSSGGKVHNKLKWLRYWCWSRKQREANDIPLQHDKAFYFQKC